MSASSATKRDPTQSKTLRRRYARRLRAGFADINTEIRNAVRDRDIFLLDAEGLAEAPPTFTFETDAEKTEAFVEWLRRQQNQEVLRVVQRDDNTFVRAAYGKGIRHADKELRRHGVTVPTATLDTLFNQPVHRDALQLLHTRNYEALEGITRSVSRDIARELTDGFAQGYNPRKMARRLTDQVDSIGKVRATTLARTEVLNAHNQSFLSRVEEMGIDEVAVKAEILTAQDSRVCEICAPRNGEVMSIEEARNDSPPWHPNCRCTYALIT